MSLTSPDSASDKGPSPVNPFISSDKSGSARSLQPWLLSPRAMSTGVQREYELQKKRKQKGRKGCHKREERQKTKKKVEEVVTFIRAQAEGQGSALVDLKLELDNLDKDTLGLCIPRNFQKQTDVPVALVTFSSLYV